MNATFLQIAEVIRLCLQVSPQGTLDQPWTEHQDIWSPKVSRFLLLGPRPPKAPFKQTKGLYISICSFCVCAHAYALCVCACIIPTSFKNQEMYCILTTTIAKICSQVSSATLQFPWQWWWSSCYHSSPHLSFCFSYRIKKTVKYYLQSFLCSKWEDKG